MTTISSDNDSTQADQIPPAAAPATEVNQKLRKVRAPHKPRRTAKINPPELEKALEATVQRILLAEQDEKPGVPLWYATGQALQAGEALLEKSETVRLYGSGFVPQAAKRCGFHSRKAHHCLDLATMFTARQVAMLAKAKPAFRVVREVMAFVGGGEGSDKRLATLLAHVPTDATPKARRTFAKWLKQQHLKRNPLSKEDCFAYADVNGDLHGRLTTETRARALAYGRGRVVEVSQSEN